MRFRCIGILTVFLAGLAIASGAQAQPLASTDDEKTRPESQAAEERQHTEERLLWLQTGMERLEGKQQWLEWLQQGVTSLAPEERAKLLNLLRKGTAAEPAATPTVTAEPAAAPAEPVSPEQALATLNALKQEEAALRQWIESGQEHLPSFQSPFVTVEETSGTLPIECIAHLEQEKAAFVRGGYSKEAWFHHVFECEVCCAPLLQDVIDIHTSHVIEQPHDVLLFNFDTHALTERHQQQLSELMHHFDPQHDQILLVGRASQTGDRSYNIVLSGKRAGAITDYLRETFSLEDSQMRYLYFGYDPPQLTLEHIDYYKISKEDIATIDLNINNSIKNKINQSVVVIVYKTLDNIRTSNTLLNENNKDKHERN
jgi:outer membrane protein OmpA-like peptidoglycan-associated protein